jgi:glycosyltransferase involved in cell wall biosynthesis
MKILFLTRSRWPQIGGVEKHVQKVSESLVKKGHKVRVVSEKEIKFPNIKYIGLIFIWGWLWSHRKIIQEADIVHCHDVFIWYLPFRFTFPSKPVFTTFHGWEGYWPIPYKNILLKKIASNFSWGSIAVGKYIEKYYGIQTNKIIYGAT